MRASIMQLGSGQVRILTLNDIRSELDAKELDSWVKLTRVLTHEIMNSIAPISSLSETFLKRPDVLGTPLYEGIRAIHDTSAGLISFVDSYRKFSALQKPSPEPFYLLDLLRQVERLGLVPPSVSLTLQIEPSDLMIYADPNLIRQVLINLTRNAVQAIGEGGRTDSRPCVQFEGRPCLCAFQQQRSGHSCKRGRADIRSLLHYPQRRQRHRSFAVAPDHETFGRKHQSPAGRYRRMEHHLRPGI